MFLEQDNKIGLKEEVSFFLRKKEKTGQVISVQIGNTKLIIDINTNVPVPVKR